MSCSQPQPRGPRAKTPAHGLHASAGAGAGKGVPLQPLPDATPPRRGGAHAVPERAAGEGVVPEPTHALEERQQAAQHQGKEQEQEGDGQQQQQRQQQQLQQQQQRRRRQSREAGDHRVIIPELKRILGLTD